MKSKLTWRILQLTGDNYFAERIINGKRESHELNAHCLSCAKTEILFKYGGKVDLRGTTRTYCGSFTQVAQSTTKE